MEEYRPPTQQSKDPVLLFLHSIASYNPRTSTQPVVQPTLSYPLRKYNHSDFNEDMNVNQAEPADEQSSTATTSSSYMVVGQLLLHLILLSHIRLQRQQKRTTDY